MRRRLRAQRLVAQVLRAAQQRRLRARVPAYPAASGAAGRDSRAVRLWILRRARQRPLGAGVVSAGADRVRERAGGQRLVQLRARLPPQPQRRGLGRHHHVAQLLLVRQQLLPARLARGRPHEHHLQHHRWHSARRDAVLSRHLRLWQAAAVVLPSE